ncbi:nuclear GTPase SLIP-GC [Phanerochaete sordida]|uniref:Nuclear GTPase SLIP-GC n=1 Tax=Phanerochaete sordida TaxID=48140 RepID=A0A9P3FX25_9APHY|nr:nuclear GTPase SLIP-GC [Phanerochaete sordida]
MNHKENLMGNRPPNNVRYVKPEPQEPVLAPPPTHNQAYMGMLGDVKPIVKAEPVSDAARYYIERGMPVPSYIQGASVAPLAAAQGPMPTVGPSFTGVQQPLPSQDAYAPQPAPAPQQVFFKKHDSVDDIQYAPEDALKEGLGMVKTLQANIKKLEFGSKLRKDVWMREIESLTAQGAPTTMIAVCGATGAGKSSILNAILDDNIVPTSGMRACTAVVTEISYHPKKTIEGDVSFLSEAEWRAELAVLLDDLVDEDGNLKRSTDLRSDAGVAWQKVHAVYPSISQEQLVRMTVDQIIGKDLTIAGMLGKTHHISANDSKTFGEQIAKYIDSKDQKRDGKKKDKKGDKDKAKEKEKEKGKSLIEKMREQNRAKNASLGLGGSKDKDKKKDDDAEGPAFWPLIRQVRVKCNARALSTGAILVDLPGVADANAARNNIAKDYMKKCDCIWILAPITRAVDDKTARDLMGDAFKMQLMNGNYDDNAITFIATKCDDISCSEVIRALKLEDDPELEAIEDEIDRCQNEMDEWKDKKQEAEAAAKEMDQTLKQLRPMLAEYEEHLKALKDGASFTPKLTGSGKAKKAHKKADDSDDDAEMSNASDDSSTKRGKKRKAGGDGKRKAKRRKSDTFDDDDDFIVDDDEDLAFSDTESEKGSEDGGDGPADSEWDEASNASKDDNDEGDDEDKEEEEVTEEGLQAKIDEHKDAIKQGRTELSEFRRLRKEATDAIASLKKREHKAQREKNAFCSRKRSEFSRDVLKQDFRTGLKDLDDAAAEQRDPDAFDPTVNLRDYDAIDLPVFTCSARDYVRIKGQVKGDGDPTCFTKPEDTGVPALQEWCHALTVSSRERAARTFLAHLKAFSTQVKTYVAGIGDVTVADREALREKWESSPVDDDDDDDEMDMGFYGGMWPDSDPYGSEDDFTINGLARLANPGMGGMYSMRKNPPKVDRFGELIGITPRLGKDFASVVDNCVKELQARFREGLEEKCRLGAINASTAAVDTSDTFAASMHWATYRATLRRHGSWRQDLNVELSNPFTRQIASTWSRVFEADLFASFEHATNEAIARVLKEVEESAAPGLKERARGQAELALEEAKVALHKTIDSVRETINDEQKEISRCLAPHVQDQLVDGYDEAMLERGRGSVARQKIVFHNYVSKIKDEIFDGAADVILARLAKAAESVGKVLDNALGDLAEKIEVSVAVLWEGTRDDPAQVKARAEVVECVTDILREIELWQTAAQLRVPKAEVRGFA